MLKSHLKQAHYIHRTSLLGLWLSPLHTYSNAHVACIAPPSPMCAFYLFLTQFSCFFTTGHLLFPTPTCLAQCHLAQFVPQPPLVFPNSHTLRPTLFIRLLPRHLLAHLLPSPMPTFFRSSGLTCKYSIPQTFTIPCKINVNWVFPKLKIVFH